ncbi:rhamnogalacturonan lyase family protein, partial [Rhizocola hellebori]|uniref:rhamnogalacturonan lyase family protein n=1 Tax=Rhizocola hellebori TaxID=1392758 RepID=UPI00357178D5
KRRAGIIACTTLLTGAAVAFVVANAQAAPVRYEAENAPATCDGVIESNHAGFSGSGFCNANNAVGAASQFTVNAASGGSATLGIRYANGTTTARPADVLVNGSVAAGGVAFNGTGAWTTYVTVTLTVTVNAGNNTVRLSPTTANGLANIDFLDFELGVITPPTSTPPSSPPPANGKQMEDLNRGLISVRSGTGNFVSWRMLGTEPSSVTYRLFRGSTLVATQSHTNFLDAGAAQGSVYTVRAVINGVEQPASESALQIGSGGFFDVPLQIPGGGTTPDGVAYTYSANDASVGDLDGDGQYEIVLKWDPSNSKDNSQSGYTGNVF